jgi:hypothetical protein
MTSLEAYETLAILDRRKLFHDEAKRGTAGADCLEIFFEFSAYESL